MFFSGSDSAPSSRSAFPFTFFSILVWFSLSFLAIFVRTCLCRLSPSGFTETPFTSLPRPKASGFSASPSGSRFRTSFSFPHGSAVHEASDVLSSMSFIFFEDLELTSSISHVMEDEHDSKRKGVLSVRPFFLSLSATISLSSFTSCVGEGLVSWPHLLGEVHRGSTNKTSEKLKGRRNCLRKMKNERKKVKVMKRSRKSERTLTSCMHGDGHGMEWDKHSNILSHAMCARNECDNTEQGLRRVQHYAHALVFSASCCFSGYWFSRCHWCRTPQRPAGKFHSSTGFHHAYVTPSAKFFSSGCCSPIVSCHRQLNLYAKFLHISHRENGSFEVLSLHTPSVTVDRRQM